MIYLFDKNEELTKVIPSAGIISAIQKEALNGLITFEAEMKELYFEDIKHAEFIGHKDYQNKNIFYLYKIDGIKASGKNINVTGLHVVFDDLKSYGYIRDRRIFNATATTTLGVILENSRWQAGNVEVNSIGSTNFYDIRRLDALSKLIDVWKCEVGYRMIFDGQTIVGRFIDLYNQRGSDTGKRFVYGHNTLVVEFEESRNEIYTAIVPRGKGEEKYNDEGTPTGGYGRKITIEEVEWSKVNGNPLDKPLGQDYVEIPEMTALYGYSDGSPRFKIIEYNDIEEVTELIEVAYEDAINTSRPKVQFSSIVEKIGNVHLGDNIRIIRRDLGFYYSARIFEVERNLLNNKQTKVKLGDHIDRSQAKKNKELRNELKNLSNSLSEVAVNTDNKNKSLVRQVQDYLTKALFNEDGYNYDLRAGNEQGLPAGYYSFNTPIDLNPQKVIYVGAGKMAIANSKDSNGDWNWTTWATGDGLVANAIVAGMLIGGKVKWNLEDGTLLIGNSPEDYFLYWDGSTLKIRGDIDISNNETIKDIQENIVSIKIDINGVTTVVKEEIDKTTKTIETYGINIISNKPENWEQGFIDEDTGEEWDMDDPSWEHFTQFGYNCRIRTKDYIEIDPTKFYVFSEQFLFKVYATNIQVYFYDAVSNYLGYQWHYNFLDPERIPEGTAKIRVSLMEDYQYSGSPIVYITPEDIANSHFKIEQGTEATDWTPCINDVSLNANLDNIKIGDEPDNPDDGTLWLAEFILASQLLCFDGEDWIAVGWGEIKEILNRVRDVEVKQSQIIQTIDGITQVVENKAEKSYVDQTAAAVTLEFKQLSVGGENLLLKSDVPITSNAYLLKIYDIPEPIADGEEVTLQIKGYLGDGKTGFGIYNSGDTVQMALLKPEDIRNKNIYTKTFNWVVGGSENRAIHVYVLYSNVTVDSNIEWIKLERGNRATDKSLHKSELKGSTYRFDKDGFSIGGTGGDTAQHTNSHSKYNHSDGSYTQISSEGLKRFVAGTGENYHYLLHVVNFIYGESSSTQAYWIQLPEAFKGKQFKVYFAISDSMTTPNYKYAMQRFVCTRHPDFSIDYANARVPVIAYKSNTLMDGYAPILNEVQGIMLAIY